MTSTTDFRPRWKAEQHPAGHDETTAMAVGWQLLARHIAACAAEDMEILGVAALPEPRPWMVPVTRGSDEERRARVDAFAKRHGVRAHADEASGQYKAVLTFGPVSMVVYMIAEADLSERLAAFYGNLATYRAERDAMPAEAQA